MPHGPELNMGAVIPPMCVASPVPMLQASL
jgi:hypothetical protein